MWLIFALKLLLGDFLWSSFLVFSISAWPRPALRRPAMIITRIFMYGIQAILIGTATAIAMTNHGDISKFFYFLTGLFFALPAASVPTEKDDRIKGFALVTNGVLYSLFVWVTFTHPQFPANNLWRQIAEWIAV